MFYLNSEKPIETFWKHFHEIEKYPKWDGFPIRKCLNSMFQYESMEESKTPKESHITTSSTNAETLYQNIWQHI